MFDKVKKILKEDVELDWIDDVNYEPLLGDSFTINDICFNDDVCTVNINDDGVIFILKPDKLADDFDYSYFKDSYRVKELLYYNGDFRSIYSNDNYYDVDTDEINYISVSDEVINRFNHLFDVLGIPGSFQDLIDVQKIRNLDTILPKKLANKWDYLESDILSVLGSAYSYNAWSETCDQYNRIISSIGDDVLISLDPDNDLKIEFIGLDNFYRRVNNCKTNDFTCVIKSILDKVFEYDWDDYWYQSLYTTNEGVDEINSLLNGFLDDCLEMISDEPEIFHEELKFRKMLYDLGFELKTRYWSKNINENTYFIIKTNEIFEEEGKVVLSLMKSKPEESYFNPFYDWTIGYSKSFKIPLDKIVDYVGGALEIWED
jgi:hypothetical protein